MPHHFLCTDRLRRTTALVILFLSIAAPGLTSAQQAPFPGPPAQSATSLGSLTGRVIHNGSPLPATPVALHRVTQLESGEVARTVTNAAGEFRFPLEAVANADFNVFFVTAEFQSVRYFGAAVHPDSLPSAYQVQVYDTASVLADPVRMASRNMVLIPEEGGSWEVNEVVTILNPGNAALVAGSGMPTWEFELPDGAGEFQAGSGQIEPHEVSLMENQVLLLTPVIPGARDLFIRYRIPARPAEATFQLPAEVDTLNLFVQQPSHLTSIEGLSNTRVVEVEGLQYLQYSGFDLAPGTNISFTWSGGSGPPVDPRVAAVVATILLLLGGVWAALRNKGPTAA